MPLITLINNKHDPSLKSTQITQIAQSGHGRSYANNNESSRLEATPIRWLLFKVFCRTYSLQKLVSSFPVVNIQSSQHEKAVYVYQEMKKQKFFNRIFTDFQFLINFAIFLRIHFFHRTISVTIKSIEACRRQTKKYYDVFWQQLKFHVTTNCKASKNANCYLYCHFSRINGGGWKIL